MAGVQARVGGCFRHADKSFVEEVVLNSVEVNVCYYGEECKNVHLVTSFPIIRTRNRHPLNPGHSVRCLHSLRSQPSFFGNVALLQEQGPKQRPSARMRKCVRLRAPATGVSTKRSTHSHQETRVFPRWCWELPLLFW